MEYHNKYKKYKSKYLNLKGGNIRYDCKPTNKFSDICIPNVIGKYKSKESCVNDCETKYIDSHLIQAHLKTETIKFTLFIRNLIDENCSVYLKGGNVLGLIVLKMIYTKYGNNDNEFIKYFEKFLKLNLVKDWDFVAYTKKPIDDAYHQKLDKIAKKYNLVPKAKTFILYQSRNPILINDNVLLEISIVDSDAYSKLEIPLTTMKIKVNRHNLKYIYMLSKIFLSYQLANKSFDLDILKKIINKINIIVHPHKNGLYDPQKQYDIDQLSPDMIKFIEKFAHYDKKISQFLITHLKDPFRLLSRLPEKNIPKNDKIKEFIKTELKINPPSWLLDTAKVIKLVRSFIKALGYQLYDIYQIGGIQKVIDFMNGISFNRIGSEYKDITDKNKELLYLMFDPLLDHIDIERMEDTDKLINFLKFINNKKHKLK